MATSGSHCVGPPKHLQHLGEPKAPCSTSSEPTWANWVRARLPFRAAGGTDWPDAADAALCPELSEMLLTMQTYGSRSLDPTKILTRKELAAVFRCLF